MFNSNGMSSCFYGRQFLVLLGTLFFCVTNIASANVEADWHAQFGGSGNDFSHAVASDGSGTYVVGTVTEALPGESHLGLGDAFIRKYDKYGNILWTDQFGSALHDEAKAVAINNNYVVVVGTVDGTILGETSAGGRDIFIRVYEQDGILSYTEQFGTAGVDEVSGVSIDDMYMYLTGKTNGAFSGYTSSGGFDAYVLKRYVAGSPVWVRQFGSAASDAGLGVSNEATGIYVQGITNGSLPGFSNQGGTDNFIRKYSAAGTLLWESQFGTADEDLLFDAAEWGPYVYVVGDSEGALPGQTLSGDVDGFVRKYDAATGGEVWTRQFGTVGFDEAYAVEVDASGVYVAGFVEGDISGQTSIGELDLFVRKYDFAGTDLYTRLFGTAGTEDLLGFSVQNGNLYLAGSTQGAWSGYSNSGGRDAYLLKVTQDGDSDGLFDDIDDDTLNASISFSDGNTYGTVVTAGDQTLSIKDSPDSADGVLVVAEAGGGALPAQVFACGISNFFLNSGDAVTITCGSVTAEVLQGEIEVSLVADDGRVAETTIGAGNTLTFEAVEGTVTAPVTNTQDILVVAGNETVSLAPGAVADMPSDLPITIALLRMQPAVIPVGSSTQIIGLINSPADETSVITAANYWVVGGAAVATVPVDGTFDSASEEVVGSLGMFSAPGVYEVCMEGFDNLGNNGEISCTILAVYDPAGGYVTGGGQFESPAGAYQADVSLAGTAHFGFVAEYESGTQEPVGNTQFKFQAGGLKFKSTSYEWLVVAGARVQYKGYGKINNEDGYRFMLTAIDGDLLGQGNADDAIRMKIWNDITGVVMYDNQATATDTASPDTVISNGNIVIHPE